MCNCEGTGKKSYTERRERRERKGQMNNNYESEQMEKYRIARGNLVDTVDEFNRLKETTNQILFNKMLHLAERKENYLDEHVFKGVLGDTEIKFDEEDTISICSTDVKKVEFDFYLRGKKIKDAIIFYEALKTTEKRILELSDKTLKNSTYSDFFKKLEIAILEFASI